MLVHSIHGGWKLVAALMIALAINSAEAAPPIWEPDFGTALPLSDDSVTSVPFGTMSFPFVGSNYTGATQLYISSNGFVSLGGSNGDGCCGGSVNDLVGGAFPRIAPLWLDILPSPVGVYVNTFSDDADPAVDRIVVTWNSNLFDNHEPVRAQVQLRENGTIVFGYDGLGPLAGFNDDTLIGLSPGNGVADPGSSDLTNNPFNTGSQPTVYQLFVGSPPPIDVDQTNLIFTPRGRTGWAVSSVVPEPATFMLTAIALVGPLFFVRQRRA